MPDLGTLEGRVALVTGAASGIGAEAARLLARHGARIAAADRDLPGVRRIAAPNQGACDRNERLERSRLAAYDR